MAEIYRGGRGREIRRERQCKRERERESEILGEKERGSLFNFILCWSMFQVLIRFSQKVNFIQVERALRCVSGTE